MKYKVKWSRTYRTPKDGMTVSKIVEGEEEVEASRREEAREEVFTNMDKLIGLEGMLIDRDRTKVTDIVEVTEIIEVAGKDI